MLRLPGHMHQGSPLMSFEAVPHHGVTDVLSGTCWLQAIPGSEALLLDIEVAKGGEKLKAFEGPSTMLAVPIL